MKIRNGKKNVSFSLNQLHTCLWLRGGPFSLQHIFVLHKLFLLCSWPPLISVQIFWCRVSPLLLFVYHVYFGWLSLKTFVSSNIDFAPKRLFPQAVVLVLTVLFFLIIMRWPSSRSVLMALSKIRNPWPGACQLSQADR